MSEKAYSSGNKLAQLDKDEKELIGHTWLTHVKRKDSSIDETGNVIWHSLNRKGVTKYYDVLWNNGRIERNININELKAVKVKEHSHGVKEKNMKENVKTLSRRELRKIILEEIKRESNKTVFKR